MTKTPVQFRHNGADVAVFVDGGANLLNAIRDGVGDTSPKFGCGQGTCGACTVLLDGEPRLACLTLAVQCGFCTPGMLMAAKALLDRNPAPSRAEVVEAISGNICRCTGYDPIIEAILAAARTDGRRRA